MELTEVASLDRMMGILSLFLNTRVTGEPLCYFYMSASDLDSDLHALWTPASLTKTSPQPL